MKRKTIFVSGIVFAIGVTSWSFLAKETPIDHNDNNLLKANVEALADGDQPGLDCSYTPIAQECTIRVSAEVAAKIFGKKVAQGESFVEVQVSGAQECEGDGKLTCQPVRCYDIQKLYLEHF